MDAILISANSSVIVGLCSMMEAAGYGEGYVHAYVEVDTALLVTAIAKLAEDIPQWFPRGKWATIQAIEQRIAEELEGIVFMRSESGKGGKL